MEGKPWFPFHDKKDQNVPLVFFVFVFAPPAIGHAQWVTEPLDDGKTMRGGARGSLPCFGVLFILAT